MLAGACVCAPRLCAAHPDIDSAATSPQIQSASAQATDGGAAWLNEISLNGFLSTTYGYNFNRPPSGTNQFRVFDFDDNTFKLDVFELVVQKAVAKPRDAGFRVDFTVGSSIPRVAASAGLFRDASGVAEDIDVHQAFVSWIAPTGNGLRFDVGKFITHFGYEVIEGYDAWNDNATRSILFGFAIPFTHVGARASYALSPKVSVMAMVVNGWDVARDNNRSKSVGGQIALTTAPALTVYLNGMWGPEQAGNDANDRSLLDAVAILKVGRLTVGANGDYGREQFDTDVAGVTMTTRWSGVAGYVRLAMTPSFALAIRGESFNDRDGVRTGTAQTLDEFTITPELRLTRHLLVRGDARIDRSTLTIFQKPTEFSKTQPTVLLDVIYSF